MHRSKAEKAQGTIAARVAVYRRSSSYVVRNGLKSGKQAQRGSEAVAAAVSKHSHEGRLQSTEIQRIVENAPRWPAKNT